MPNVTAQPREQVNGDVVTEFIDSAGSAQTRWEYAKRQDYIRVYNGGAGSIAITVNGEPTTINPGGWWEDYSMFDFILLKSKDSLTQEVHVSTVAINHAGSRPTTTVLEVSPSYNSSTLGWGVTMFSSMIVADNSIIDNGYMKRYEIHVHEGYYTDWETAFPGYDATKTYTGIICKDYVDYIGDGESKVTLKWDGLAGFAGGHLLTFDEYMQKCIFHIIGPNTKIKGFNIISKNTRYCVHSESSGNAKNNTWTLENLILEYQGVPDAAVATTRSSAIGIGISPGETGIIGKGVKFAKGGLYVHNNKWNDIAAGSPPIPCPAATIKMEGCDLRGNQVNVQSVTSNGDVLYDQFILKDVQNIGYLLQDHGDTVTYPTNLRYNWRFTVEGNTTALEQRITATNAQGAAGALAATNITRAVKNGTGSTITKDTLLIYTDESSVRPIAVGDPPGLFAGIALCDILADGNYYLIQYRGIVRTFLDSAATSVFGTLLGVPTISPVRPSITTDLSLALFRALEAGTNKQIRSMIIKQ